MSRRRRRSKINTTAIFGALGGILLAILAIIGISKLIDNGANDICHGYGVDTKRGGYCLTSDYDYDQLVIVTGNTQNTPAPEIDFQNDETMATILHDVFYNTESGTNPDISIVSASGDNHSIDYDADYRPSKNTDASNNNLSKLAKSVNKAIKEPAIEAGADYVGGIMEAKNLISSSSEHPVILVVGSGYSDSGVLDFAHDEIIERYKDDPTNITNILEQDRRVESQDLKNVAVYWYNLGNVVAPQPSMNDERNTTQGIYQSLFSYLGAKNTNLKNYNEQSTNAKSVDTDYTVQPTFASALQPGDTVSVNESIGKFKGNSDELLNSDETSQKLKSFARKFNASNNIKLKLTGYIAYCAPGSTLGQKRAVVIKNTLVDLGVPADLIEVGGEAGSPPENDNEAYSCNSSLPDSERRTVIIRVVGG